MQETKSLKQYCKEAKQRLKSGFWQNYKSNLQKQVEIAEQSGVSASKVKEYYSQRVYENIKKPDDEEGEISNAIGRLTDEKVYASLSYEEKQRYSLNISERYLKAVERYKKESLLGVTD